MNIKRREFLWRSAALSLSIVLPELSFANTGGQSRLVVILMRGAVDGLAAMPPYADPRYVELHRDLAIAAPNAADGALELDRTFGLHPALEFLHESYRAGELVAFHAAASPYRERSHFDGQNVLENGMAKPIGSADGWLNRALATLPSRANRAASSERAVAISQNVPLILRGDVAVMSKSPQQTAEVDDDLLARLADLYSKDDALSARLSEGVQSDRLVDASNAMHETAATVAPANNPALDRLVPVARMAGNLMRSDNGPEIAVLEATGWDTHANQGNAHGILAQRLGGLDRAVRTLHDELGVLWANTAVAIVTEFGRTAAMNGSRGTDHGTGGCAFLLGGAVQGGRVIADWPGLATADLLDGRDLRPTLDLRSMFKSVLADHLHVDDKSLQTKVFPDSRGARPLQGLIRA